jgi:hypothetical protein
VLADHIAKIDFLKKLGADRLNLAVAAGMLKAQARSMLYRKPATLRRMHGERKTLKIACFLRLQLLRLTDDGLGMIDYRIADLWRQARRLGFDLARPDGEHKRPLLLPLNAPYCL